METYIGFSVYLRESEISLFVRVWIGHSHTAQYLVALSRCRLVFLNSSFESFL